MELYKISFPHFLTRKEYIGISSQGAERRFREHCASKKKYPIVMAIKKYGRENAIVTVLEEFDCYEAMYRAEQLAITEHGTKAPNGYNLTDGGKGTFGLKATDERKAKISRANKGRKATPEQRKRISEANKGRDMSAQVAAMAKANKGRKRSDSEIQRTIEVWTGRKHRDETKRKMSESASKRRASDETKEKMSRSAWLRRGGVIYSFISPKGEVVKTDDLRKLCLDNNLSKSHMYNVHNKKADSHKGWSISIN